ncbi:hypothetical protein N0B16_11525 [Chryseobacterium sp. GMJ5]|uniref:Glycoside hydrolase family 42 N-terminal domain-containing protein n=1 Tax=Chryseobacterium gilvum TaxID=2976534 RepID=A0ABT2VYJ0_9FLAO|nr:hypothetical protein [Chryseobacterium gilvum]MCU7615069.1 hypothetical protein [Chryseobacterium gilvum]
MQEAGFSLSLMTFSNHANAMKALNAAKQTGIKLILSYPELYSEPQKAVPEIKNHSSLEGYYMGDEPPPTDFPDYIKFVEKIKKYDQSHFFYANLFPNYVLPQNIGNLSYNKYISKAVSDLPISFISFDHYPLIKNKVRENFYENLELIRRESKLTNKPFWGFACTTIHFDYLKPEISGIKLQHFANLLYGAQGLQYFTYWTMKSDITWKKDNYSYAIVDDQGNPTPTYNVVKTVNQQIQRLAWIFAGAKSEEIYHTGNEIPRGTKKLNSIPKGFKFFSTFGKNALVSLMSNGNKRFVIIQNKSLDENLDFKYQLQFSMKKVNNNTGKLLAVSTLKKYNDTILPGDILIFTYDQ